MYPDATASNKLRILAARGRKQTKSRRPTARRGKFSGMEFQRSQESIERGMEWSCVGVGSEQAAYRHDKTRGREFFETVVF